MPSADAQGLHWLASHEPNWPKHKWPEARHYHELKPSAGLKWPDKVRFRTNPESLGRYCRRTAVHNAHASLCAQETGALDALRKAVEDAGKHHEHVAGHLNANMNRTSPMWGEVRHRHAADASRSFLMQYEARERLRDTPRPPDRGAATLPAGARSLP